MQRVATLRRRRGHRDGMDEVGARVPVLGVGEPRPPRMPQRPALVDGLFRLRQGSAVSQVARKYAVMLVGEPPADDDEAWFRAVDAQLNGETAVYWLGGPSRAAWARGSRFWRGRRGLYFARRARRRCGCGGGGARAVRGCGRGRRVSCVRCEAQMFI